MGVWTPRGEEDDEDGGDIQLSGMEHLDGPGEDPGEVTFELDEWGAADRQVLADRLVTLGVPHSWEGTTLVIAEGDEAWVELVMDGTIVAYDPTHHRRAGLNYITVATGRDFADVTATSGVLTGSAIGRLHWSKQATVVDKVGEVAA